MRIILKQELKDMERTTSLQMLEIILNFTIGEIGFCTPPDAARVRLAQSR